LPFARDIVLCHSLRMPKLEYAIDFRMDFEKRLLVSKRFLRWWKLPVCGIFIFLDFRQRLSMAGKPVYFGSPLGYRFGFFHSLGVELSKPLFRSRLRNKINRPEAHRPFAEYVGFERIKWLAIFIWLPHYLDRLSSGFCSTPKRPVGRSASSWPIASGVFYSFFARFKGASIYRSNHSNIPVRWPLL